MGEYIVPEGTLDRTTTEYDSEHQEFNILVNGRRIHSMNPAQFAYFRHTIENSLYNESRFPRVYKTEPIPYTSGSSPARGD